MTISELRNFILHKTCFYSKNVKSRKSFEIKKKLFPTVTLRKPKVGGYRDHYLWSINYGPIHYDLGILKNLKGSDLVQVMLNHVSSNVNVIFATRSDT